MMSELLARSREVILHDQQPGGAYPACPTMPDYQFCWFRDGSFIAHAMLLYGEQNSAAAFHGWAARTIMRYETGARRAMIAARAGQKPDPADILRARYTYDGGKGPDEWPEFQLDGLGTWLWTLKAYDEAGQGLDDEMRRAAELVAEYLAALWSSPCHDLWEEHGDLIHTYTLGAIYAGLSAAAALLNRPAYLTTASLARQHVVDQLVSADGSFIKASYLDLVDASLVGLATPYRVVEPDDARMGATLRRLEADVYAPGFGVHRYRGDTYYGGGAWLLLAAWLGWVYAERGDTARAQIILSDIEKFATPEGYLPEQVAPPMLADESYYHYWVQVRGPIATPLLWSHAMHLILAHQLAGAASAV